MTWSVGKEVWDEGGALAAFFPEDSRAVFENLLFELPMMIMAMDGNSMVVNVNQAVLDVLGYSRAEMIGKLSLDMLTPQSRKFLKDKIFPVLFETGRFTNGDVELVRKNGETLEMLMSAVSHKNAAGRVDKTMVVFADLTARHRQEAQLRKAQKMEAVGQLTAGVAHDFNNLLTVIIGNLQLVEKALTGDEKAEKRAREAIIAANKGSELTQQLLAFARRQPLAPQEVEVNDLIKDMGSMLARSIGGSIELKIDLMEESPVIKVDRGQLESSILNLAVNARDAMDQNGKLTIETSEVYLDETSAKEHEEIIAGRYVMIAVSDTGHGIPAHVLDNIFQPFFTTKEVGKGTGLGLSMVFGFIKQSGGHVRVYSEEGHGSEFKLYLPQVDVVKQDAVTLLPEPLAKKKILVTEDQDAVRMVAVDFLEDFGYEVVQACNGAEALEILADQSDIALLFTDIVMPGGMNGFDLSQAARQLHPGLKIIHASGYPKGAMIHRQEPQLEDNLICKPYRRDELRKVVAETLGETQTPVAFN